MKTYEPKTNGKNRALFIELKRIEMEVYRLLDKHEVPIEEQVDMIAYFRKMRDVINHSEVTNVNKTRKRSKYRVVITVNGKRKTIIDNWINLEPATNRFNILKEEAKAVDLPKIEVNHYKTVLPVKYEVLLLKRYEPGDIRRFRRDELGKVYEEDFFDEEWVILDSADYYMEEQFNAFGYPDETFDIRGVITEILPKHLDKYPMKQMYVINHRVYLEYGNKMDIVVAQTPNAAWRLYSKLTDTIVKAGMTNIFCIGRITDTETVSQKYDEVMRVTGWSRRKVTRTNTLT